MKKQIIVIDDEPLISTLIKEVIDEDTDFEISKMATRREEFLEFIRDGSFDAALVDISVGGREEGLGLIEAVRRKDLNLPVIIVSAHDEIDYALKCLLSGARGYLNKNCIFSQLVPALKTVLDGRLFVSGMHGSYILQEFAKLQNVGK